MKLTSEADLGAVGSIPGVRGVGQDLAVEERFDASLLQSAETCSVSRRSGCGSYSTTVGSSSATSGQGTGRAAGPRRYASAVDSPDDGWRGLRAFAWSSFEGFDLLGGVGSFRV